MVGCGADVIVVVDDADVVAVAMEERGSLWTEGDGRDTKLVVPGVMIECGGGRVRM